MPDGNPSARRHKEEDKKTDGGVLATFEELFAGEAGLTKAVDKLGNGLIKVQRPHDTRYGQDITKDDEFVQMLEAAPPDWRHMAPPCRTFTRARRKDRHGCVQCLRTEEKPQKDLAMCKPRRPM